MLATVCSFGLGGIEGFAVRVEVNLAPGLPAFEVVGLPGAAVRESRERVRAALKNGGFGFPTERITVNLAPADLKKEGPAFDLPIALGLMAAKGLLPMEALADIAILGELSLDGSVRPVRGLLNMVIAARQQGIARMMIPAGNAAEVACIEGIELLPAAHLRQAVDHLGGREAIQPLKALRYHQLLASNPPLNDFAQVRGQQSAKRALEIAAAGGHNVLMVGPPGSGKTLMARCLPGILPEMSFEEALESTRIHSVSGSVPESGLLTERPFRAPHHTASQVSLVGGGPRALPGEISKAHNGVLFLDELPEYRRDVLEALRQPMEDGFVTVTRASAQVTYPSGFMLVCSMNPCPCGHYGSRTQQCRCTPHAIHSYLNRISGPLLDRIDMHLEIESIPAEQLTQPGEEESSRSIRERVERARRLQWARYQAGRARCNARLSGQELTGACATTPEAHRTLMKACELLGLSNRAYTRLLKVSRTIADLAGSERIGEEHVAEAIQYRTLDKKYWG